ncbi:MAG: CPBP family intramembrane metalloprotease [Bacteroidaceae bacterium]|nr:CPBP family intramembrane metalloprotease [Bacteroidaceae bacterium]
MKRVWLLVLLAFLLWTLMFSPWTAPFLPFWWMMTVSASLLTFLSSLVAPGWWRRVHWSASNVAMGIGIAIVLWCVFWVGDKVSAWLFDFARPQVNLIYGMKTGESPWLISTLLLCLIGPAEEIFWRGYVQEKFSQHYSPNIGFLLTTACYTMVHVASFNFMLIMASMVCGLAWGGLYRFFPQRFSAILLSHALWDAAVFVWFPIE